jgi:hypothetical protein
MNRREALTATAAVIVAAASPAAAVPDPDVVLSPKNMASLVKATREYFASPWRVFRVSDYEWYVARSPLEALMAAAVDWGCRDVPAELGALLEDLEREGLGDAEPEEADLDELHFADVDENDNVIGPPRTFREELAQRVAAGLDEPELFAAAEW